MILEKKQGIFGSKVTARCAVDGMSCSSYPQLPTNHTQPPSIRVYRTCTRRKRSRNPSYSNIHRYIRFSHSFFLSLNCPLRLLSLLRRCFHYWTPVFHEIAPCHSFPILTLHNIARTLQDIEAKNGTKSIKEKQTFFVTTFLL